MSKDEEEKMVSERTNGRASMSKSMLTVGFDSGAGGAYASGKR